jgi:hypothetical protein
MSDIESGIEMTFNWFKKNNPTIETVCDEETMDEWYYFVQWCYAQNCEDGASYKIKNNPEIFNFEISDLMKIAMAESDGWWCKYSVDHQQDYKDNYSKSCENCEGEGYLYEVEGEEEQCDICYGEGLDPEDDSWYDKLDQGYLALENEVDTSTFEKLSKIKIL